MLMPSDLASRALTLRSDKRVSDVALRVLVGSSVLAGLLLIVCGSQAPCARLDVSPFPFAEGIAVINP
jgi:hypothetical protein